MPTLPPQTSPPQTLPPRIGHQVTGSETDYGSGNSAYGGIASETSSSRDLLTIQERSSPLPPVSTYAVTPSRKEREVLRQRRQSQIESRIQAVSREMGDLKANDRGVVSDATEMDEMREQMHSMREELVHLRRQQNSAWAQGLSNDAPPDYDTI
ncbi:hypothetical protein C0991_002952 [Blastosporella zonata]|nr:hypothetical protein C0991_002952 [Blastosporella zonata]